MSTVMMIDGSFYCFWRYFGTKAWYVNHTKKGTEDKCNVNDPEFMSFYCKHFNDRLAELVKKFEIGVNGKVFWFSDVSRQDIWRNTLKPDYKGHRFDSGDEIGPMIAYSYANLIPSNRVISVPTAEADDCCAVAVRYLNSVESPDTKIVIITADTDYIQLCGPNISIYDPKAKKMLVPEVKLSKELIGISAAEYLTVKCLVGDKSDGIDKVYPGCTPRKALEFVRDLDVFKKEILDNQERNKNYMHNRQMIDFDNIPTDVKNQIVELFKTKYVL